MAVWFDGSKFARRTTKTTQTWPWILEFLIGLKLGKRSLLEGSFSICWITFHFQEFQSAAIGKKLKLGLKCDAVHDKS